MNRPLMIRRLMNRRRTIPAATALGVTGLLLLTGCGSGDSFDDEPATQADSSTIVIGSQDYYSNEIIAEIYAQALEAKGFSVQRDFRIGQREVYMPEIESSKINLFPEYSGNLLQYYDKETTARTSEQVYGALGSALPQGLTALDQSPATDQDSYNVTAKFAAEHNLKSVADLAKVAAPLTLGGNSELETRPYGPTGLAATYNVNVKFTPIEDSGGPLTLKALLDGDVQLVDIFSADPAIFENDLVTLADPEGLFLASNVVPITSGSLPDGAVDVINGISARLTSEALVSMNSESTSGQKSAAVVAAGWLATVG